MKKMSKTGCLLILKLSEALRGILIRDLSERILK